MKKPIIKTKTSLVKRVELISPMIDQWRNTGSTVIEIWEKSTGEKIATVYETMFGGRFDESVESARSRYKELISKGYRVKAAA